MLKEFKEFALKGNVIDLAVGVIIGAAFGKIVTSMVSDIIMPPIGKIMGNVDFKDLFVVLDGKEYASLKAARDAGAPVLAYGSFFNAVIDFAVVAFCIFLLVKAVNALRRRLASEPAAAAAPTKEEKLLMEIRDAIRAKNV